MQSLEPTILFNLTIKCTNIKLNFLLLKITWQFYRLLRSFITHTSLFQVLALVNLLFVIFIFTENSLIYFFGENTLPSVVGCSESDATNVLISPMLAQFFKKIGHYNLKKSLCI